MNCAPHRIRSLRWQVEAGSTAEAFAWRAALHEKGTDLLLPVLEQGLDEAAGGERVIHIPKLELSIRLNSLRELESSLSDTILVQIREQLQRLPAADGSAGQTPQGEVTTTGQSGLEILLHYLQTGSLPWQATGAASSEQTAILRDTCRDQWPRIVEHLKTVREDAPFHFRLLQLLSREQSALLIRVLPDVIPPETASSVTHCLELLLGEERERFSRCTSLSLMASILAESMAWRENPVQRSLLKAATAAVPPQERHLLELFIAGLSTPAAALFRPQDSGRASRAAKSGGAAGVEVVEQPDSSRRAKQPEESVAARPRTPGVVSEEDGDLPAPGEIGRQSRSGPSTDLFPLLVRQAGLVLLHPWLVRFLENCGVKQAGSAGLQFFELPRAAALLHFLATGREELYEYELGLVKILLGQRPETPLPVCEGLLTANDIEEAEALLQSAVEHWSALKNTSIQGLRSSFIERQGLLREEESGWKLNVERRPHDILMDQLPWSIGIIKLPWMQKAIFSEW